VERPPIASRRRREIPFDFVRFIETPLVVF
jgi:hypothetical protein